MSYPSQVIARDEIVLEYPGFENCRRTRSDTKELRESIETNGLMTPPMVWRIEDDDGNEKFILIAGFRRMQALAELCEDDDGMAEKYAEINCTIYEGDLSGATTLNMVENVQRDDLNPADAADAVGRLFAIYGTQEKVGAALGKSQPWVSGYATLHGNLCSKAKTALRNEQITLAQAKLLSKLAKKGVPNEEAQVEQLMKLLRPDSPDAGPSSKKAPVNRTLKDVLDLRLKLVMDSEGKYVEDEDHANSLLTVLSWFLLEVSDEDVVARKDFDEDYAKRVINEAEEATKPRGKGRPELTEEEKAEKAAEKAAAAEQRKADKAAAKEQEKADKIAAKEAEKQAKLDAASAKKEAALAKAAEKVAATAARAAERVVKEEAKAAKAAAAEAAPAATPKKALPAKADAVPVRRAIPATTGRKLPAKK